MYHNLKGPTEFSVLANCSGMKMPKGNQVGSLKREQIGGLGPAAAK